jgi:hypothetical protein
MSIERGLQVSHVALAVAYTDPRWSARYDMAAILECDAGDLVARATPIYAVRADDCKKNVCAVGSCTRSGMAHAAWPRSASDADVVTV